MFHGLQKQQRHSDLRIVHYAVCFIVDTAIDNAAFILERIDKHAGFEFLSGPEDLGHLHPNSTSGQLPPRIPHRNFVHQAWSWKRHRRK